MITPPNLPHSAGGEQHSVTQQSSPFQHGSISATQQHVLASGEHQHSGELKEWNQESRARTNYILKVGARESVREEDDDMPMGRTGPDPKEAKRLGEEIKRLETDGGDGEDGDGEDGGGDEDVCSEVEPGSEHAQHAGQDLPGHQQAGSGSEMEIGGSGSEDIDKVDELWCSEQPFRRTRSIGPHESPGKDLLISSTPSLHEAQLHIAAKQQSLQGTSSVGALQEQSGEGAAGAAAEPVLVDQQSSPVSGASSASNICCNKVKLCG